MEISSQFKCYFSTQDMDPMLHVTIALRLHDQCMKTYHMKQFLSERQAADTSTWNTVSAFILNQTSMMICGTYSPAIQITGCRNTLRL